MKALGGKLVTAQVELPPDMDGILDAVKNILKLGNVQSIKMVIGEPIVYQRVYSEKDNPFEASNTLEGLTASEIVRQRIVEESPYNGGNLSGADHLVRAFLFMSAKGLVISHLVLAPGTKLWWWLGVDPLLMARATQLMGAKLELDKTLTQDKALLCGSNSRNATLSEIEYSLVVHMEVPT